ncbi:MAG: hypothetical protein M0035_18005 [Actinomycetota bacterium]|nr:hypothetical protein [Actinomycetota bacterium]
MIAGVHQVAFEAWSHPSSHIWRVAADLAGWPDPLAQTLVVAAGAAAILVVATVWWGFTRARPWRAWATVFATAGAALRRITRYPSARYSSLASDDFDPRRLVAMLLGALLALPGVFG